MNNPVTTTTEFIRRLNLLFRRRQASEELDEEMHLHLELRVREMQDHNSEAVDEARRRFGNATQWKETSRDMWGWSALENFAQDLRYAFRMMRKASAFAAAAILTLGLGIGVNTAIFSTIYAVLLRPLPYRDSARLIQIWETHPVLHNAWLPYPDFVDLRAQNRTLEDMAAFSPPGLNPVTLVTNGQPEQVQSALVSDNLLPMLGVRPMVGENFRHDEAQPGHDQVALLGHTIWQRRFNGNPSIVGQFVQVDGKPLRVVGVLPRGVQFPLTADILVPVSHMSDFDRTNRKHHDLEAVGRLKPSVSIAQADADLRNISLRLQHLYPATNNTFGSMAMSLQEQFVGDVRTPLLILLAAVGLILLIACANVANLLLTRASLRRREIAVRLALGANRLRLIQQLLLESSVISIFGGLLGVLLAAVGMPALRLLAEKEVPRASEIGMDPLVLGVTLLLSIATGILFGLPPALQATERDQNEVLRGTGRTAFSDGRRRNVRRALVVLEVALAIVVLTGAGLLVRSLTKLLSTDPGFRPERLLTFTIPLSGANYQKPEQQQRFFDQLLPRLQALPTVEAVANIDTVPFTALAGRTRFLLAGAPPPEAGRFPIAHFRVVSPNYFQTIGMALHAGRQFREADIAANAPPVVIVNMAFVRRFLSDRDPVGRGIILGVVDPKPQTNPVVGVVSDARDENLALSAEPTLYFPSLGSGFMVRTTAGDPLSLANAVSREVRAVDPGQPIADLQSMEQIIAESISRRRFSTRLLTGFSALALLLAAIGLYGLIAYSVTQRTQEIGVRMALGSTPSRVFRLVLGESLWLTGVGLMLGLLVTLPASRLLNSMLYGIQSWDPLTLVAVTALLVVVSIVAALLPAQRATAVDPMVALRYE
jgi:putative ABC transport system permease protein